MSSLSRRIDEHRIVRGKLDVLQLSLGKKFSALEALVILRV